MKRSAFAVCISAMLLLAQMLYPSPSQGVPSGQQVEFKGGKMGRVVFSGMVHAQSGQKCTSCHPKYFMMKRGSTSVKYADHTAGKNFCFGCHNGSVAFAPAARCADCHKRS